MKPAAFITGGTGSIGQAVARELAADYHLYLHYCRDSETADQLKEELSSVTEVSLVQADFDLPEQAVETVGKMPETPELFVHCAGVSEPMLFQEESSSKMMKELNIAVVTPAAIIRKLLPVMIQKQKGNIIFISSIWGDTGASLEVTYSTCKSAQHGLVKALAREAGPSGIRVNAVAPGAVDSEMMNIYSTEEIHQIKEEIPFSRFARPEEIASCVKFLAESSSSYISGHIMHVNGGWYT